ncbi:MAG: hypothetical protein AAGA85_16450 [Bacteroidota bacterium]
MSRFSEFLNDIEENITEGARAFKKMSQEVLEEVKDKAEQLYEAGAEKFEQASAIVQNYIDQYEGHKEIKSLSVEKTELQSKLGDTLFHEFKKNGTISKRFLTTKRMTTLMDNIEAVDKKILELGKELDKKNKETAA